MTRSDKLRICTKCGNVYSITAGLSVIGKCPSCGSTNRRKIDF